MLGIVLFGFIGIIIAGLFWYKELTPWIENMYHPKLTKHEILNIPLRLWGFFVNFYRLFTDGKFLLVDMAVTIGFASVMGFGEGMAGGILGIWASNIMSVMIFIYMRKKYKKLKLANK